MWQEYPNWRGESSFKFLLVQWQKASLAIPVTAAYLFVSMHHLCKMYQSIKSNAAIPLPTTAFWNFEVDMLTHTCVVQVKSPVISTEAFFELCFVVLIEKNNMKHNYFAFIGIFCNKQTWGGLGRKSGFGVPDRLAHFQLLSWSSH